jgi:long-chain acyl-CoA synthetase
MTGPSPVAIIAEPDAGVISRSEMAAAEARLAAYLLALGFRHGSHIALLAENHPRYLEVVQGVLRAGLRIAPLNYHMETPEIAYMITATESVVLISTQACRDLADAALAHVGRKVTRLSLDPTPPAPWAELTQVTATAGEGASSRAAEGGTFTFFSSGSTGVPKGVLRPLSGKPPGAKTEADRRFAALYGFRPGMVSLSPAPLYHAAPLVWANSVASVGGTTVLMSRFDARAALELIDRHRVTHQQAVPTMLQRMLRLPREVRDSFDTSSLETVVHSGGPCTVELKHEVIGWLGPIVHEYYSGSESAGRTVIGPEDWLGHPGSVGRAWACTIHILDADGTELSPLEEGEVWFDGGSFQYLGDDEATRRARNAQGWTTIGDIGYLDADEYLFLTDRKSNLVVTGGVNVYPQEAESALSTHPQVRDVAVTGLPDDDLGEIVTAFVELEHGVTATDALAGELLDYCRSRLALYKCPRVLRFTVAIPRMPSGKIRRSRLRASELAGSRAATSARPWAAAGRTPPAGPGTSAAPGGS